MNVSAFTAHPAADERISVESFETDRLVRRLALLEESIAEGERALRGEIDPRTGLGTPPALGQHRAQLLSNLATEREIAGRIRSELVSRS